MGSSVSGPEGAEPPDPLWVHWVRTGQTFSPAGCFLEVLEVAMGRPLKREETIFTVLFLSRDELWKLFLFLLHRQLAGRLRSKRRFVCSSLVVLIKASGSTSEGLYR